MFSHIFTCQFLTIVSHKFLNFLSFLSFSSEIIQCLCRLSRFSNSPDASIQGRVRMQLYPLKSPLLDRRQEKYHVRFLKQVN